MTTYVCSVYNNLMQSVITYVYYIYMWCRRVVPYSDTYGKKGGWSLFEGAKNLAIENGCCVNVMVGFPIAFVNKKSRDKIDFWWLHSIRVLHEKRLGKLTATHVLKKRSSYPLAFDKNNTPTTSRTHCGHRVILRFGGQPCVTDVPET